MMSTGVRAAFLLLLFLIPCASAQQSTERTTCQVGKISLQGLPSFTTPSDVFSEAANVIFHFCRPTASAENPCESLGPSYVKVFTSTACLFSFTDIETPLTVLDAQNTYFVVAVSTGESSSTSGESGGDTPSGSALRETSRTTQQRTMFRVNMRCNSTGISGELLYAGGISVTEKEYVTLYEANFTSADACESNNFFCETDDDCVGSSCLNGVCIDTTCVRLENVSQTVTVPSNYLSMLRVTDCYGFPVQGLSRDNISIFINGSSIDEPPLSFEVDNIRRETGQKGGAVQITTLMIHQSRYVTSQYEDQLKEALGALIRQFSEGNPTNHYVALAIFDGSPTPITLQPHTNDFSLLTAAVNTLPVPMPDPLSTNLYGAIVFGLKASYQMRSAFTGDVYTNLAIFSDGYDTSARLTEREAIQSAQWYATRNVTILALGMSNRSDPVFLKQIATSGYFEATSVDSLASAFVELAERITSLHRNVYYVLMCIPTRKGNINVTVSVGPESLFPSVLPLSYEVDTDEFGGGCNETVLEQSIGNETDSSNSSSLDELYLPPGGFITETISAFGSLFFYSNCSDEECVVSANNTESKEEASVTVLVLVTSRCVLSPFCFDYSFNDSYTLSNNVSDHYKFMLISGVNKTSKFTVTSQGPVYPTIAPPFLSPNQTGYRSISGDADLTAIILFAVFTILMIILICLCVWYHRREASRNSQRAAYRKYAETNGINNNTTRSSTLVIPQLPQIESMDLDTSTYAYHPK